MQIALSPEQVARLEACRIQFNRLTGQRWSLQQFIKQTIQQAIEDSESAAAAVRAIIPQARKAAAHGLH